MKTLSHPSVAPDPVRRIGQHFQSQPSPDMPEEPAPPLNNESESARSDRPDPVSASANTSVDSVFSANDEDLRRIANGKYGSDVGDDLVQDAWIKLKKRESENKLAGITTVGLVLKVIHRLFLDSWRKRKKRNEVPLPLHLEAPGSECESDFMDAIRENDFAVLRDALDQLREKYREIIYLKDIQRLTYAEIRDKLGNSTSTLQERHEKAIKALRDILSKKNL